MSNKCIKRNSYISIVEVSTNNQQYDFVDQNRIYIILYNAWSAVKTKPFNSWYGVSNLNQSVSHVFNIRYSKLIFDILGEEKLIIYNRISFLILGFENKNERNKEIIIYCKRRGFVDIEDIKINEN